MMNGESHSGILTGIGLAIDGLLLFGALAARLDHMQREAAEQSRLAQEQRRLAFTDGLTGIANRRAYDEALAREWERSARDGSPLSLVPDRRRFLQAIQRHVRPTSQATHAFKASPPPVATCVHRPSDVFARYGGEEFAALLPQTDEVAALAIAESMCAAVPRLAAARTPPHRSAWCRLARALLAPRQSRLPRPHCRTPPTPRSTAPRRTDAIEWHRPSRSVPVPTFNLAPRPYGAPLANAGRVKRIDGWVPAGALCALLAACGGTSMAAGGDTIFVANYATASVTIYTPPYAAAPVVLQVGAYSNGRPVALAYDSVARRLFVGAGNVVQIYREPLTGTSKPERIVREASDVLSLSVEHRFYKDGLLEVATSGPNGGIQAYSGRNDYAGAPFGRVDRVIGETMAFDTSGRLFVARPVAQRRFAADAFAADRPRVYARDIAIHPGTVCAGIRSARQPLGRQLRYRGRRNEDRPRGISTAVYASRAGDCRRRRLALWRRQRVGQALVRSGCRAFQHAHRWRGHRASAVRCAGHGRVPMRSTFRNVRSLRHRARLPRHADRRGASALVSWGRRGRCCSLPRRSPPNTKRPLRRSRRESAVRRPSSRRHKR